MASAQKKYPYSSAMLYNLVFDIAEMYKAKVTENNIERVGFTTEMYGQMTDYLFIIEKQEDGCLLSVETTDEDEESEKQLSFMLSIVDNMLAQLPDNNAINGSIIEFGDNG